MGEGLLARLKKGLAKTRSQITSGVEQVFARFAGRADEALFEELEEALILADLGAGASMEIVESLRRRVKAQGIKDAEAVRLLLVDEISAILAKDATGFALPSPAVVLVIGVNGVGKTTTIGKLAHMFKAEGRSVLVAAADTFRAAAVDQLAVWCERSGVPLIRHTGGTDPAAVVYDAAQAARARGVDVLLCDTAGRLHNKKNLMDELAKINRTITAQHPDAHREAWLVLDATTGQNALQQAKFFKQTADVTGLILAKLDGTAKGGVVIAVKNEMDIPIRYVTLGEGIEDIQAFDAGVFARALFE